MLFKVYLETTIISYLAARPSKDLITAAHQPWNCKHIANAEMQTAESEPPAVAGG